jgi:hypothetical protein
MDRSTYDAYKEFGTEFDPNGKPVKLLPSKPLVHLTASEREVYDNLSDPKWASHRRFEQERVPLPTALAHVQRVIAKQRDHAPRGLQEHRRDRRSPLA